MNTIEKEIERAIFTLSKRSSHTYKPDKFEHLRIRNGWYFIYPGGISISSAVSVIFYFSVFVFVSVFCLHFGGWFFLTITKERVREQHPTMKQQLSIHLWILFFVFMPFFLSVRISFLFILGAACSNVSLLIFFIKQHKCTMEWECVCVRLCGNAGTKSISLKITAWKRESEMDKERTIEWMRQGTKKSFDQCRFCWRFIWSESQCVRINFSILSLESDRFFRATFVVVAVVLFGVCSAQVAAHAY